MSYIYSVYHRVAPEGEFIKKQDYVRGFGMNTSHYFRVCEARRQKNATLVVKLPVMEDFKDDYELRSGTRIDGKQFNTRPHPLLGRYLKDNVSGDMHLIEGVYKHFYFGFYWVLLVQKDGSHGTRNWENISSKDEDIIEWIKETRETTTLI